MNYTKSKSYFIFTAFLLMMVSDFLTAEETKHYDGIKLGIGIEVYISSQLSFIPDTSDKTVTGTVFDPIGFGFGFSYRIMKNLSLGILTN